MGLVIFVCNYEHLTIRTLLARKHSTCPLQISDFVAKEPMDLKQLQRRATRSFETSGSTQRHIATSTKTENIDYTAVVT
jgi:hypothetical protein